jgi:hypothetical protein
MLNKDEVYRKLIEYDETEMLMLHAETDDGELVEDFMADTIDTMYCICDIETCYYNCKYEVRNATDEEIAKAEEEYLKNEYDDSGCEPNIF